MSYSISLDTTGTYTFNPQIVGYGSGLLVSKSVRITNTGNQPTGALSLTLSGVAATAFSLSALNISSLAVNGSTNFTVIPRTGLSAGTYTATVTVSGNNGISAAFIVSFTVNSALATYGISLDTTGTYTFRELILGYGSSDLTSKTVIISNTGNQATGSLNIVLTGNTGIFTLSKISVPSIAAGMHDSFVIAPKLGLQVGTYNATITVSGGNSITASFNIKLDVSKAGGSVQVTLIPIAVSKMLIVTATGFAPNEKVEILLSVNRAPSSKDFDFLGTVTAGNTGVLTYGLPFDFTQNLKWGSGDVCYITVNGTLSTMIL
jgi:uncharacterized membrane protein